MRDLNRALCFRPSFSSERFNYLPRPNAKYAAVEVVAVSVKPSHDHDSHS